MTAATAQTPGCGCQSSRSSLGHSVIVGLPIVTKNAATPARRELAERGPVTAGTLVGAGDGYGGGKAAHIGSTLQPTSRTPSPVISWTEKNSPIPFA